LAKVAPSIGFNEKPAESIGGLFENVLNLHKAGIPWEAIAAKISQEIHWPSGIKQISQKPWPSSLQPRGVEVIYDSGEKICFNGREWLYIRAR
jgi:hypothetical protein